ncbi:DUF1275 domain-containing protein [Leifsonia sp. ZF2019]|uniref:YoaK family protein n=1 Tax=Leifsonia sp. ZF2019 TaxID=2781978 RepID=UPI001CC04775|nr:YoaK family protein [Leifsonia sp. ZF2019]UAJ81038.1 DUF1275 domain-containing protein [Leifsonia sp. ZF2019]
MTTSGSRVASRDDLGSGALWTAAALSLIAGATDVTSWLLLGGFFSAHVTGNLVVLAADAVTGHRPAPASLLAIPVFVVVVAVVTVTGRASAWLRRRRFGPLLAVQTVLLAVAAVLSFTTTASADPAAPLAVVIGLCAVAAMATQNAYLHLLPGAAFSTAVMTGNLVVATMAAVDLVRTRGHDRAVRERWTAAWPLLTGFIVGCLVGATGASMIGDHAAITPAALSLILAGVTAAVGRRRGGGAGG